MLKWEIAQCFVPLEITLEKRVQVGRGVSGGQDQIISAEPDYDGKEAWKRATDMAYDGWELVSVIPVISGHEFDGVNSARGSSYMSGYTLFFKRPIEE